MLQGLKDNFNRTSPSLFPDSAYHPGQEADEQPVVETLVPLCNWMEVRGYHSDEL